MEIYIKTDNLEALKNTILSARGKGEFEFIVEMTKPVASDLWTLGEVEQETLKAGDLILKSWGKKPKVYKGTEVVMSISEALKGYHVLRLTEHTKAPWYDYYDRVAKKIGGYSTQWAL